MTFRAVLFDAAETLFTTRGSVGEIYGSVARKYGSQASSEEIQDAFFKRGDVGGFSGAVVTQTGGAIAINLYTNPQQDVSVGVRHIPITVPLIAEYGRYREVLKRYPPNFKIGFAGN